MKKGVDTSLFRFRSSIVPNAKSESDKSNKNNSPFPPLSLETSRTSSCNCMLMATVTRPLRTVVMRRCGDAVGLNVSSVTSYK